MKCGKHQKCNCDLMGEELLAKQDNIISDALADIHKYFIDAIEKHKIPEQFQQGFLRNIFVALIGWQMASVIDKNLYKDYLTDLCKDSLEQAFSFEKTVERMRQYKEIKH